MSTTTPNLGLFKYNTTTDSNVAFNINNALNNNWDIIDTAMAGGGLPDQTDKADYLLTTDGTEAYWGETGEIYPVVETFLDGDSWYRVYSDGWCEQGGKTVNVNMGNSTTCSFLKAYKDTTYCVSFEATTVSTDDTWFKSECGSFKTTSFVITNRRYTGSGTDTLYYKWMACGYIEV